MLSNDVSFQYLNLYYYCHSIAQVKNQASAAFFGDAQTRRYQLLISLFLASQINPRSGIELRLDNIIPDMANTLMDEVLKSIQNFLDQVIHPCPRQGLRLGPTVIDTR